MAEFAKEVVPVNLEDEMRQSYLDYAMSVIVGRALPDVCDGLKPVHRRILYAMRELHNEWNRPYKKSARVVGDVIGKYHPHGEAGVYPALVRMAQDFSMRYPLIDGQGNFGSVDGDPPAAMRYTEVRMTRITQELLSDIEQDTVDFVENYDGSDEEPQVLPARFPQLLVNGSTGIAVGMATNIPPHNLGEVLRACLALLDDPDISLEELMVHIPGPDFPTAAIINGAAAIRTAYETGRGVIHMRARATIEGGSRSGQERIVVTELPYQVNKARLLEKIALMVKQKQLEGISGLRDESDKDGLRVVIDVQRGVSGEVLLNQLFRHSALDSSFGINMLALTNGRPKWFTLKQLLESFIAHRRNIVTRRSIFQLQKARQRGHVLEGLAVALCNIDAVIALIRAAANAEEARQQMLARPWDMADMGALMERGGVADEEGRGLTEQGYLLSVTQVQAILDLRLHRLTGLERDKISTEYQEQIAAIERLLAILRQPEVLLQVIRGELESLLEYDDPRRTEIRQQRSDLSDDDLVTNEKLVVTLSRQGYVKVQPLSDYRVQRRGGRGRQAARVKTEDFIQQIAVVDAHDTVLYFSSHGKVYWKKAHKLPYAGSTARGRPVVNLLSLADGEQVSTMLAINDFSADAYLVMVTEAGVVKKTALSSFSRPRPAGIIALRLAEGDRLVDVALTDGKCNLMLFASNGRANRFPEADVRVMGRMAAGVRGIRVEKGHHLVALLMEEEGKGILAASAKGYGKISRFDSFPLQRRGGKGVIAISTATRNGALVGVVKVGNQDDMMLITNSGTLVRIDSDDVPTLGRNTKGVRLIRLSKEDRLVALAPIFSFDGGDDVAALEQENP